MSITCPDCHAALEPQNGIAHCDSCNKDIPLEARCPDCHQPLQVLKACGAVDYFCQNGHGLISKTRRVRQGWGLIAHAAFSFCHSSISDSGASCSGTSTIISVYCALLCRVQII